jgi:hypothetical protein
MKLLIVTIVIKALNMPDLQPLNAFLHEVRNAFDEYRASPSYNNWEHIPCHR